MPQLEQTMKICMIVKNNFLYDSRVKKEALSLVKRGHEVTVLAVKDSNTAELEKKEGILIKRVHTSLTGDQEPDREDLIAKELSKKQRPQKYYRRKMTGLLKKNKGVFQLSAYLFSLLSSLLYSLRTTLLAIKERSAVYHCHDLNTLLIGYFVSLVNRKPFVYDSHELWTERNADLSGLRKRWDRFKWSTIERSLIKKAFRVITVNDSIAEFLQTKYRITKPETLMNCPHYQKVESSNAFREVLSISNETRIVLYEGGITFNRGIEQLILSASHLDRSVVVILGYGTPSYLNSLKDLIDRHKVHAKVHFVDAVPYEKIIYYLSSADLGVDGALNCSLSYYFGLGNKIFEYLMAGLPIVVSDFYPETRKILEKYDVGITFDPQDPLDLAGKINEILL